jgi:hypothetical protein
MASPAIDRTTAASRRAAEIGGFRIDERLHAGGAGYCLPVSAASAPIRASRW